MSDKDYKRTALAKRLKDQHNRFDAPKCLSMDRAAQLLDQCLRLMFPHFSGEKKGEIDLVKGLNDIERDLRCAFEGLASIRKINQINLVVESILSELPSIADMCYEDAVSLFENDPAANSIDEVILCYPGFYAVAAYRIAHAILQKDIPLLPRVISEHAHQRTGIDIHPAARIGHKFFIDHGTGVVIGGTAIIGDNVKLYQGVTIGALRVDSQDAHKKRHPTIEDNVVVYASATILGGDTVVGKNSVIGGNVWLTKSVAAGSRVMFKASDTEDYISIEARRGA